MMINQGGNNKEQSKKQVLVKRDRNWAHKLHKILQPLLCSTRTEGLQVS